MMIHETSSELKFLGLEDGNICKIRKFVQIETLLMNKHLKETKAKVFDLMWRSIDGQVKLDQLLAGLNEQKVRLIKKFLI